MSPQAAFQTTFAETDRGVVREKNEDSLLLLSPEDEKTRTEKGILAIVADGVGGAARGKTASNMAVNVMRDRYYGSSLEDPLLALKESMEAANRVILNKARQEPSCRGMATTCTAFLLLGWQGFIAHLGDSRAYLFRRGELSPITRDHTLVNRLVGEGLITAEAALIHPQRNIITKSLGSDPAVEPDTFQISLEEDDIILLCSDGLYGLVPDEEIASRLSGLSLQEAGSSLVELAKNNGGTDNITVVMLRVSENMQIPMDATRPYAVINERKKRNVASTLIVLFALLTIIILYLCSTYGLNFFIPQKP